MQNKKWLLEPKKDGTIMVTCRQSCFLNTLGQRCFWLIQMSLLSDFLLLFFLKIWRLLKLKVNINLHSQWVGINFMVKNFIYKRYQNPSTDKSSKKLIPFERSLDNTQTSTRKSSENSYSRMNSYNNRNTGTSLLPSFFYRILCFAFCWCLRQLGNPL